MFGELVAMARNFGGSRGGLIQMEGSVVYLANVKRSALFKMQLRQSVGTGTFYASESPVNSERIERRGERVLFEWKDKGNIRRVFVPDKKPFKEDVENALGELHYSTTFKAPIETLDYIEDGILVTQLRANGNYLTINQKRSDRTVTMETKVKLSRGLAEESNHPDSGKVSIFTQDLVGLKGFANSLMLGIVENQPVVLGGDLSFGGTFEGLIGNLTYEEAD